ncbi:Scarecrow-like protein 28 [Hibiscus syriacus]|uniref:Scarecrow-like protein 28 n=1 Tax=Hibiscus syriacus TaxID=106335 RepID=A0A6A2XYQ9_HIBSY|nr:Scarecrow-like protein 28 [Hibiscus syriacus]
MRCCAHILNLIVQDGLSVIGDGIERIKDSVYFWSATQKRIEKFEEAARHLTIDCSKQLSLDCKTRWNSTYLMLSVAIVYKDVFKRLKQREAQYRSLPTDRDWELASSICGKLQLFYKVTLMFSGTKYPTANVFFPSICEIRITLSKWSEDRDEVIKAMGERMLVKFDKYWSVIHGVMGVVVVLDPRYKFKMMEYAFPKIYGFEKSDVEIVKLKVLVSRLFQDYETCNYESSRNRDVDSSRNTSDMEVQVEGGFFNDYFTFVEDDNHTGIMSELDHYLQEKVRTQNSELDILSWWKTNGFKYPTLQKIARDILAIPISTVASESAFSTSGRLECERQLAAKEASLPHEPAANEHNDVTLLVRMPDGSRRWRRFLMSDRLQSLYDFIDISRGFKPGTYRLVRPYPRRAFGDGERNLTLNELGLTSKHEALFLELILISELGSLGSASVSMEFLQTSKAEMGFNVFQDIKSRHRLRSESSAQFQACHFPTSMSTQRLDLPCSFSRKDTASRSQPIRPVGLSNPFQGRGEIKDELWEKGKCLKRFAEGFIDESVINRAKRKKGSCHNQISGDIDEAGGDSLSLAEDFWFQPGFNRQSAPQVRFSLTCSGDEERSCFMPSEVISPPLPSSNNPWTESVITDITDVGEKNVETTHRPVKEASGSSTSSESHSMGLRLNEQATEYEVGNGSGNPRRHEGAGMGAYEEENNHGEHQAKLGDLASPRGSAISRLTAYYTEALALRVTRLWPHIFHITTPRELDWVDDDNGATLRLLNQISPIPKFVHFKSNEILLRAFEGKDRVHIIDFDIKQGLQWPSLFQSLAARTNPPSHVRVTGIGESKQELNETGYRLSGFAEVLNLPFEFQPVVDRLEDVRLWMLHVKEKETVAVNCAFQLHKTLYDGNGGALRDFLGLVRSTNPTVVVMAEQEAEHNVLSLEARVANSLRYYSAIFDSIDSSLPMESPVRIKVEETFAREIRSIIACEGRDRVERHESFEKWRKLMEEGRFRCMGITDREVG